MENLKRVKDDPNQLINEIIQQMFGYINRRENI